MLYVIPFILLLVIAIVLKKRDDANKENSANKAKNTNSKKTAKKNTARSARTSQIQQPQSKVVEDDIILQKKTTPLTADFKKSIEKLIHEKNFFSAEAKINQSLNQDNSQHELYLYLLDVHVAHKDDLAIGQLLNHIRSLGLDDIAEQAEAKNQAYESQNQLAHNDAIEFDLPAAAKTEKQTHTDAAFDALVGSTPTAQKQNDFEQLQNKPVEQEPLSFSLTEEPAPVTRPQAETPATTIEPLEFNFTSSEISTDTAPVLDLSAEYIAPPVEVKTAETIQPLDFTFDLNPKVEEKPEVQAPDLAFKFDAPVVEEAQPSFNLELESPLVVVESLQFETKQESAPIAQSQDPLAQSFPALIDMNEIQLNLELASQYIRLGAYTSARELLTQDEHLYSPEQREKSQLLLNKIAS